VTSQGYGAGVGPKTQSHAPTGKAADLARAIADSGYPSIVLDRLASQVCRILGVERTRIFVSDERHPGTSILAAGCGVDEEEIGSRLPRTEGGLPRIVQLRAACPAPARFRPVGSGGEEGDDAPYVAALAPFGWQGRTRGELAAESDDPDRTFAEHEIEILSELAELVGAAVWHFETKGDLYMTARDGIEAVMGALDQRDRYTAWHSQEVVELAREVGSELGLTGVSLFELELAALLHDLGKLGIPDAVLNKPGPLDPEEMRVMQLHPVWGAELLATIPGLEAVAAIVRFHHERVDGSGYPAGLTRERIPAASRVIAACDAFHAMTSDRPYRDALDFDAALAELRRNAGTQFDPAVVGALTSKVEARAAVA
jgi:hypothetical protein